MTVVDERLVSFEDCFVVAHQKFEDKHNFPEFTSDEYSQKISLENGVIKLRLTYLVEALALMKLLCPQSYASTRRCWS